MRNLLSRTMSVAALALVGAFAASAVSAATCTLGLDSITISPSTTNATLCAGPPPPGHQSPKVIDGMTYNLGQLVTDSGSIDGGDSNVYFTNTITDGDDGMWEVSTSLTNVVAVLVGIKQGTMHSLFEIDISGGFPVGGTWSVIFNGSPTTDVSHSEVWYKTGTGVVPIPAGLPLLAAGLGVLGLMARRKRKAA